MGHGSGGALTTELLREVILPIFHDVQPTDGAVLEAPAGWRLAFTTDTFVVRPVFFPGGDIGSLAVNGTVNDLAMMGARPAYLSCGLVLEEGFPLDDLEAICRSMRAAAAALGLKIVTGDTKVVGRGEADGIFINTAGIGFVPSWIDLCPAEVRPGDAVIVSGGIGEHGTAVLAGRLGVSFDPVLVSDTAPLWPAVAALLDGGVMPVIMRDITRGGLASVSNELAAGLGVDYLLREASIPVDPRVKRACEIWGYDPLHVASEGRFMLVVHAEDADRAVAILRSTAEGRGAAVIGEIARGGGKVFLHTAVGGRRLVKPLPGELLPRIC